MSENTNYVKIFDPDGIFQIDLLSPLKNFLNYIGTQLFSLAANMINALNENVIKPLVNGLNWIINSIITAITDFISKIISTVKSLFIPSDPEKIAENLPRLVLTVGGISLGTGVLLSVIGTKIGGSGIEIEPLAKMVSNIFRTDYIISFSIGALLGYAIREPLNYYYKKLFRPLKPDPYTLFNLYTRGYITREQLKSELAYTTGFKDIYIDGLIDIFEFNPSLSQLMRLADYVEIPNELLDKSLKVLGIREPYYSIIWQMIKRRPLREEIRKNTDLLITAYTKGYISEEFLSKSLDALKVQTEEKNLLITYAKNKRTFEIIEEQIYILRTAYQKGLIDAATLVNELSKLGIQTEWINLIKRRGDLFRKIELPIPKVSRAYGVQLTISTSYQYSIS
jgi:hypothetical protein